VAGADAGVGAAAAFFFRSFRGAGLLGALIVITSFRFMGMLECVLLVCLLAKRVPHSPSCSQP
jgi:hypothetical protein